VVEHVLAARLAEQDTKPKDPLKLKSEVLFLQEGAMREYQTAYQDFSIVLLEQRVLNGRLAEGAQCLRRVTRRLSGR
jgi:hypothetical protein